jgi:hypothetical protein
MKNRGNSWFKFFKNHLWEIGVILALIFFFIIFVFHKAISAWLKDKEEFGVFQGQGHKYLHQGKTPPAASIPATKKNEARCRQVFEDIFQRPFPTVRPSFLKRGNGRALELDGYNKDLKLAFEYQGIQHYKYSPWFHRSVKDYESQVQRDREKREMCKRANVTVIEIPHTVKYDKLDSYIRTELRKRGLI